MKNRVDIPAAREQEEGRKGGREGGEGEREGGGEGARGRVLACLFFASDSSGRMSKGKRWASSRGTRTGLQAWSSEVRALRLIKFRHGRIVVGGCLTLLVWCQSNPHVLDIARPTAMLASATVRPGGLPW